MTAASIAGLKADLGEAVEKAKEISGEIRERVDSTYRTVNRGIKRTKVAAEDAIDSTRHHVKERPLTAVAAVGIGAFAIGVITGWLIAGRKS